MPVSFDRLRLGDVYDRPELAELWGYQDWHAIGRGIVTPAGDNKVILFVTREKQETLTQYRDHFEGDRLFIDGETNHANDNRLVNAASVGDETHLFYRDRHHSGFTYYGPVELVKHTINSTGPSRFEFETKRFDAIAASALVTEEIAHGSGAGFLGDEEGRRRYALHISYERSPRNRREAIRLHGTVCQCCGFNFNAVYGAELAHEYIEIHHKSSLAKTDGVVNPAIDLVPLCSNCHSMVHRKRDKIISVEELREIMRRHQEGQRVESPRSL
jgi:5-methylcytosine-specific restriction protein A